MKGRGHEISKNNNYSFICILKKLYKKDAADDDADVGKTVLIMEQLQNL